MSGQPSWSVIHLRKDLLNVHWGEGTIEGERDGWREGRTDTAGVGRGSNSGLKC